MIVAIFKILVSVLVLTLPVMLAARIVGAKNKSFLFALIVVTLQFAMLFLLTRTLGNQRDLIFILAILLGTWINSIAFKTTLLRGFAVGVITIVGASIMQATLLAGSYAVIASAT